MDAPASEEAPDQAAQYIASLTLELAEIARRNGLDTLSHINVETAARNAVLQQRRDALIADIEHGLTPLPPPPPEPAVVEIVFEESQGPSKFPKLHRWFS